MSQDYNPKKWWNSEIYTRIRMNKEKLGHTLKEKLGQDTCHLILFTHALLGCDSTSRIHGVGKGLGLRRLIEDNDFQKSATGFMQKSTSKEEIKTAGEDALLIIYGSSKGGNLNKLRREIFEKKETTANSFVHPEHFVHAEPAREQCVPTPQKSTATMMKRT
ncbi:hypothetical protein QYM36_010294 [Artemia franciscana]|uniref:Uncharacterized protein n=1 Tax=Artemia franciscana TaxID=6661 RepID=A0AA88HSW1_ARTSF|nr:hypothetical protein QYM36_010294 [Artemia franciscana]